MKWNKDAPVNESREYFMEHPVFEKLLKGFLEKYRSYGSFSGTVTLKNLTLEDREILEGFFKRSFHGQKSASISAKKFESALQNSRFSQVTPEQLLEACFGRAPVGKKEEARMRRSRWRAMFEQVEKGCQDLLAQRWLEAFREDPGAFPVLSRRLRSLGDDVSQGRRLIEMAVKILCALPAKWDQVEYRAVFAAKLTGNPHSFDDGEFYGRMFYELVKWYDGEDQKASLDESVQKAFLEKDLFPAQKKQRLYLKAGILLDDLSNYTMLSGVGAVKKDGTLHKGMDGFCQEEDMVLVPLSAIVRWSRVWCISQTIYIVENPSVFSVLQSHYKGQRSLMCMNGQPRLSALLMLDLLAAAKIKIFYAGDFDPEGLTIAQKLCQYYQGDFEYWHMSPQDCMASLSEEPLSQRRIKMLEKITDPALRPSADLLCREKRAGYQERILERYVEEKGT